MKKLICIGAAFTLSAGFASTTMAQGPPTEFDKTFVCHITGLSFDGANYIGRIVAIDSDSVAVHCTHGPVLDHSPVSLIAQARFNCGITDSTAPNTRCVFDALKGGSCARDVGVTGGNVEILCGGDEDDSGGGGGLPDLTVGIGPDASCEDPVGGAAATRHVIGDLQFGDGFVNGTETYYLFGNEALIYAGGFTACSAAYTISGTHDSGPDVEMNLQAIKSADDCPPNIFPENYPASYLVELFADGTTTISSSGGDVVGEGFWTEGRIVYAAPNRCDIF